MISPRVLTHVRRVWCRSRAVRVAALALMLGAGASESLAQDARETAPGGPPMGDQHKEQVGTGFAVGPEQIVTAAHGVDRCRAVRIITRESRSIEVVRVVVDRRRDLALVSVRGAQPLLALPVRDHANPVTGDRVFLLGFPLQMPLRANLHSFYEGPIAGPGGVGGDPDIFRLGFVALPGMSGAAVLDHSGQVIGVVKSHMIETAPNQGPTLGGQTFVVSGNVLAAFLRDQGIPLASTASERPFSPEEIAAQALSASVAIRCLR